MLKFIIKNCFIILLITSCNSTKTEVSFLVSGKYLENIDSIKTQTPYKVTNIGDGYRLSNLPSKLRDMRDSKDKYVAWDEIEENYKVESTVHIDTISKLEIKISRGVTKWLYEGNQKIEKRISVEEFKKLLNDEGVKPKDFEILNEKEIGFDGGVKVTYLELWYDGTVNEIRIHRKGVVRINTYLISQIPYWESQGCQFSTTTKETVEKYSKNKKSSR
jgi:hypothetical protein